MTADTGILSRTVMSPRITQLLGLGIVVNIDLCIPVPVNVPMAIEFDRMIHNTGCCPVSHVGELDQRVLRGEIKTSWLDIVRRYVKAVMLDTVVSWQNKLFILLCTMSAGSGCTFTP